MENGEEYMAIVMDQMTVPLPWIRCQIGLLEDFDFICPDCGRPICYDHGEKLTDHAPAAARNNAIGIPYEVWRCVECINGEPWYPLDGISKIPEDNLIIDSKTGDWVYLAAKDEEEIDRLKNSEFPTYDGIDRVQTYINIISHLFDLD